MKSKSNARLKQLRRNQKHHEHLDTKTWIIHADDHKKIDGKITVLSERISRLEDILFEKTYEAYHENGKHYFIEYKEDNR